MSFTRFFVYSFRGVKKEKKSLFASSDYIIDPLILSSRQNDQRKRNEKEKKNEARQWLVNELLSGQDNKSTYSYPFFIHLSLSLSLQGGNNDEDNIRRTREFPFSSRENDTIEK